MSAAHPAGHLAGVKYVHVVPRLPQRVEENGRPGLLEW